MFHSFPSLTFEWEKTDDWGAVRYWRRTKITATVVILTNFNAAMAIYWVSEFFHQGTNFWRTLSSSSFSASLSSSSSPATSSSSSASSSLSSLHHHYRRHRQRHRQHYPQHHHHCQHQCRRHHCQHNRQHHGQHHRHYHHSHNIISIIIHATGVSHLRLASSQAAQLVKAHCSSISLKKARPHVILNLLSS